MPPDEDDVFADVRAAFSQAAPDPAEPPEPAPVEAPSAAAEEPPDAGLKRVLGADDGRQRDEHGRFATKPASTEPIATPEKIGQAPVAAPPEPQATETIPPPQSLTAPLKAKFASLDQDVQREFARLAGEVQTAKATWDGKAQDYNALDQALSPVKQRLALNGLTPASYVQALVTADEALRGANQDSAFIDIARIYGANLQNIARMLTGQGQQAQSEPSDPYVQALQQKLASLEQTVQGFTSSQEDAKLNTVRQEIASMRSDPAFMYFDNVAPTMERLMRSEAAETLKQAYEMACWGDPQIRVLMQQQTAPTPTPPALQPAGRQINGNATPSAEPAQRPSDPKADVFDDVRAAWKEVSGRI